MSAHPSAGAEAAACSAPSSGPKMPREALWRLDILSTISTELLPRALGVVALHAAIPATIDYALDEGMMRLAITVELDDRRVVALMANTLRRIISVEQVILSDYKGRLLDDAPAPATPADI